MTLLLLFVGQAVMPGLAGAALLTSTGRQDVPGPEPVGRLLSRGLACGVSVWLLVSGLLAATVGVGGTSVWVAAGCTALLSAGVLALPPSRRALAPSGPDLVYLGGLLLTGVVSWLPVGLLVARTTWGPLGSTPWYYAGLARQIADMGHVPATAREFGTTLPFLADYRFFSTGTAMLLDSGGSGARHTLQLVTLVAVLLLACGAGLLANAWGSGRIASLAAVPVAVATGIGALRLSSYRPEGFALGLTLLLAALCVDWLRSGHRGSLVAASLLAATLAQVHGLALLTAGVLILGALAALFPRRESGRFLRRAGITCAAIGGSVLVLGLLAGGTSGSAQTGNLADRRGLADPTWQFVRAIRGLPPSRPPDNAEIAGATLSGIYHGTGWVVGVLLVSSTVVLAVAAIRQAAARRVLVFTFVALVALAAVAAVFALGWTGYVPRRTGAQRLLAEASLLVGPYVAGALGWVPRLAERRPGSTWVPTVTVAVLVVLGCLATLRLEHTFAQMRPPRSAVRALSTLDLPAGSLVLTNAYTEGFLADVMGAEGLLEGRAPYTYPRTLARANRLLRGAHAFFERPSDRMRFLRRNRVDYVIVARPRSYALASSNFVGRPANAGLRSMPGLRLLLTTPELHVYRVGRGEAAIRAKSAPGFPAGS